MKLIGPAAVVAILDSPAARDQSQEERNRLLGRAVLEKLSGAKSEAALAEVAERLLSPEQIGAALRHEAANEPDPRDDKAIDRALSKAADQALSDIAGRGYRDIIGGDAVEIIDLGLAVYDNGRRVKAIFGPKAGGGRQGLGRRPK